jgi:hypothetical protein
MKIFADNFPSNAHNQTMTTDQFTELFSLTTDNRELKGYPLPPYFP